MWWHKLKIIGGMVFLLAFAGCSTVTIGQLGERVSSKLSSVSVVDTDGRAGQLYGLSLIHI